MPTIVVTALRTSGNDPESFFKGDLAKQNKHRRMRIVQLVDLELLKADVIICIVI